MNSKTRLKGVAKEVKKRRRRTPSTVVFWKDYEGTNLWTKPHETAGAEIVTPEQLEVAVKTKNVIIVGYNQLPGDSGS